MAGDPYKELGVSKGASADEVKKAYRKLAKELHPDKNPGDKITEDKFKRVTAAFDILGDKDKRAKYDAGQIDGDGNEQYRGFGGSGGGGRAGGSPFGQGGNPFGQGGGPGGRANFEGVDLDDLFGMFGGGGRQRGARDFTARGQDVKATLDISLEDAIAGATRRIQFSDGRTLDVTIPKGASDGQTIRLRGQGAPGRGAENGDALIELRIEAHPIYRREGADLTMDLPISVPDAVLGAKVRVPTPEGAVQMTIPAGSNSGKVLRLKGRGAFAQGRRGDLLAKLVVTLPDEPDAVLTQFAEDWRARRPLYAGALNAPAEETIMIVKPDVKPARPWFSAGPTAKRAGYALGDLPSDLLGRGIRAPEVVERFAHGLRLTREVLEVPDSHVMLYTPGSDTGAVEAALWGMLGARPVQVVAYENFGLTWLADVKDHLGLEPEALTAPWGELPDLSRADWSKDVIFPWNGTTSGVRVPDADWIADDREGLAICDATSAAFAMPLPYDKLDVVTFSFQKALGGEAGIGVMVLSPRAVERLDTYRPDRAIPKLLRLTDGKGRFDRTLADGVAINTFSVLTLEDWIDALGWARDIGGLSELIRRTDANYAALAAWVEKTDWIDFLPERPEIRSTTSVCLKFVDPRVTRLDDKAQKAFVSRFKALLEGEAAVFDMEPHRNAPPGLRLWCGCTVETADVIAATPWLEWAFETAVSEVG